MRWLYDGAISSLISIRKIAWEEVYKIFPYGPLSIVTFGDEYDYLEIEVFRAYGINLVRIGDVVYYLSTPHKGEEIEYPSPHFRPFKPESDTNMKEDEYATYDSNSDWFRQLIGSVKTVSLQRMQDFNDRKIFHIDITPAGMDVYVCAPSDEDITRDVEKHDTLLSMYKLEGVKLPNNFEPSQIGMSFYHYEAYFPILLSDGLVLLNPTALSMYPEPFRNFSVFDLGDQIKEESSVQAMGIFEHFRHHIDLVLIVNNTLHVNEFRGGMLRHTLSCDGVVSHSHAVNFKREVRLRTKSARY